jgi:hypothetical protein
MIFAFSEIIVQRSGNAIHAKSQILDSNYQSFEKCGHAVAVICRQGHCGQENGYTCSKIQVFPVV